MEQSRPREGTHYVPERIASAVECARNDPRRDLVPWAWFSLGWFGVTLRVWRNFAAADRTVGSNDRHQAVPASLGAIKAAVDVLGRRLPATVSAELGRLSTRLRGDHEDLARERRGLPLLYNQSFESGVEAATEVYHQVRGVEPADEDERPWYEFGFNLGGWLHNHHFAELPLSEELTDFIDTVQAIPPKVAITLPPVVNALRSLSLPAAVTSDAEMMELAILVKRHCQPGWEPTGDAPGETRSPPASLTEDDEHPFARILRNRQIVVPSDNSTTFQPCWLGEAVHALVEQVETDLLTRTKRPVWKRTANGGVLKYDGEVVRTFVGLDRCRDYFDVLDEFENCGWQERIGSPLSEDSNVFHKKLNRLRKGLKRITFFGDGTGDGICWSPVS
jgi:hypothetical protein